MVDRDTQIEQQMALQKQKQIVTSSHNLAKNSTRVNQRLEALRNAWTARKGLEINPPAPGYHKVAFLTLNYSNLFKNMLLTKITHFWVTFTLSGEIRETLLVCVILRKKF